MTENTLFINKIISIAALLIIAVILISIPFRLKKNGNETLKEKSSGFWTREIAIFVSSVAPVISNDKTFDFFSAKFVISFAIIVVFSPSLILNLPFTKTIFSSIKLDCDFKYVFSNVRISAVPYKSSIVTNAIILFVFVNFFFIFVIIPA